MGEFDLKRRQFFATGCAGVLALSGLSLASGCGSEDGSGDRVVAGKLSDFPLGERTLLSAEKIFIVHVAEGLAAISAKCTHQGCTVQAQEGAGGFSCACHGSGFDAQGAVLQGPASSPLSWFAVSLDADQVVVDLNTKVSAGTYTKTS
jgi:Rieske Fe-S protein